MHDQITTVGDSVRRDFVIETLLERLVDELKELNRLAWSDGDVDRDKLRSHADHATQLAAATLDELKPSAASH